MKFTAASEATMLHVAKALERIAVCMEHSKRRMEKRFPKLESPEYEIIMRVARLFHILPEELVGDSKSREFVHARWVCMYLMRYGLGMNYPQIGKRIGPDHPLNHGTVLNGLRQVQNLLEQADQGIVFAKLFAEKLQAAKEACVELCPGIENVPLGIGAPPVSDPKRKVPTKP